MSGEENCREVSIVGGTYNETCYWPVWEELYGSGWRAVRIFRAFSPEATISFHTVGDNQVERTLKIFAGTEKLSYQLTKTTSTIGFYYNHPLACPKIYGYTTDKKISLKASGRFIIGFGMIEADTQIEGEWVVYDPQSPRHPRSFREQGGKAGHLALVLNESEAKILSGETELSQIKGALFDHEECECLILKCGAKGALIFTSKDDEGTMVPVYKTSHVFPIGSGDVFTTVFSFFWFSGSEPIDAAMNASMAAAAYCEAKGTVDSIPNMLLSDAYEKFVSNKKGLVYLAGPFFTLNAKLFVSECRNILQAMEVQVFSPYHDVGEGKAEDVAPKDIEKLKDCSCVFAIVDGLDSGTLFEVGYAVALGKKVVAYVENETEGALKMLTGTGCDIEKDFTTAIYKTCWYAAE
jgi:nucleoside 2-deoxyribosyltransferase